MHRIKLLSQNLEMLIKELDVPRVPVKGDIIRIGHREYEVTKVVMCDDGDILVHAS